MKRIFLAAGVLAAAAPIVLVLAANPTQHENDALAISNARTTLADAVTAAERHAGGKAAKAELERSNGRWVFDVEVVKGKAVFDVHVAADDGRVISSKEDAADDDDEKDSED
jgi:uncharacterized membrane protein YkoI